MSLELRKRNKAIYNEYQEGATKAEIGRVYKVSKERIRQIIEQEERKQKGVNKHP